MPEEVNSVNGVVHNIQHDVEDNPVPGRMDANTLYQTRSEEVQDIMGKMPPWIIRWGVTLMAVIVLGILAGASVFKYPDIINARIVISSSNPPVKLVARNSLPIQQLFVRNNQQVSERTVLCILSNTARYADVQQVAIVAKQIDTATSISNFCLNTDLPAVTNLGELQSPYVSLIQAVAAYRFFLRHNSYGDKIHHLAEQSDYQAKLSDELLKKDKKLKEQLGIQQSRYETDSSLVAQTVMSRLEYENARKELLSQQMITEGNYSSVLQSKVQEKQIDGSIAETSIQSQTDANNLGEKVREAAKQFVGALAQWEQNYVLRSPVSGVVTFFKFWKENQFVQAGETVMMITPPVQQYLARGEISITGAGKAKAGQKALIKLLSYPYEEFGSIRATVTSRSAVAIDSTFAIELKLDNGLHTNAGKEIPLQPQLEGTAEIITDEKSIMQRLFENLYGKKRR